jgi:hypothetical protein
MAMVGFRNIVVHNYQDIDVDILSQHLGRASGRSQGVRHPFDRAGIAVEQKSALAGWQVLY